MIVFTDKEPYSNSPSSKKYIKNVSKDKSMSFQNPKGTVDYYPEDREVFNYISNTMRKNAVKYGFLEVESPAFESLSLLSEKEGEEIQGQIFTLEKRSNEQLGLRFDLTVPMARMFIAKQKELPKPTKWFCVSRMWRYEAPQKGRLREFYQLSVELFGSNKPAADAQIIALAIDILTDLGLTKDDFKVKVNNRYLLQGLLEGLGVGNYKEAMQIIDKVAKVSGEEFIAMLEEIGLTLEQITKIDEIINTKDLNKLTDLNETATKGRDELKEALGFLEGKKEFIEVDLKVARGLAYYTGTVFEIFDTNMKFRALCGGGRYNDMIKMFGGDECAATGFGMGFATLKLLLDEKMKLPDSDLGLDYYIITIGDKAKEVALKIADKARVKFKVDMDIMGRNIGKQMDYARKIGARKVIIIGDDEIESGKLTVRDMTSGKESKIGFDEF